MIIMKKPVIKIIYLIIFILLITGYKIVDQLNSCKKDEITTGLKGQVFISPVSPVFVNKVPYEALLIFVSSNNETIRKIQTEEDGKFEIALDAGNYTIIPESFTKTGSYPIGEQKDIFIKSGEIAFVEIDFDSGIR